MYDSLKEQERACKTLPSSETFDVLIGVRSRFRFRFRFSGDTGCWCQSNR